MKTIFLLLGVALFKVAQASDQDAQCQQYKNEIKSCRDNAEYIADLHSCISQYQPLLQAACVTNNPRKAEADRAKTRLLNSIKAKHTVADKTEKEALADVASEWPIEVVSTIHVEIYDAVVQVIPYFKTIDSLDAYMKSDWIKKRFGHKALIHYYHQEYDKALIAVRNSCNAMNTNPNRSHMEPVDEHWFVNLHKLDKLKPMLKDTP